MKNSVIKIILFLLLFLFSITNIHAQTITRASVASDGTKANGFSFWPSISADGRFVAFGSYATNLVSEYINGTPNVFVHDCLTGETSLINIVSGSTNSNRGASYPSISANGRLVVFTSFSSNIVSDDTNEAYDVFVYNRETEETIRASVAFDGTQGNDGSGGEFTSISADGRFIAFSSEASNLVPDDTNGVEDIFVHNCQTGETTRVSVASDGNEASDGSELPFISADGRFVAFKSYASNLVPDDTNGFPDIFVHDRETGEITRVSVASDGTQANGFSWYSSISSNVKFVAFSSESSNLVPGDTNGFPDIFVHDRETGETTRVNVASDGTQANGISSWHASISADGRFVAFKSGATNLVPSDSNEYDDIFVHNCDTGVTTRVGVVPEVFSYEESYPRGPSISSNGRFVAFESDSPNLVPGDTDYFLHIFVCDLRPQQPFVEEQKPCTFQVYPPYPNPFNPETTISFRLSEDGHVNLTIYNITGQLVRTLVSERKSAGYHTTIWDGRSNSGELLSSGIYLYRISCGNHVDTKRMILLK